LVIQEKAVDLAINSFCFNISIAYLFLGIKNSLMSLSAIKIKAAFNFY